MRSRHTNRICLLNTASDDDVAISTEQNVIAKPVRAVAISTDI